MSIWASVQDLSEDLKDWVYKKYRASGIPIDVRSHLAEWIEEHFEISNDNEKFKEKDKTAAQMEKFSWELIQETISMAQATGNNLDFGRTKLRGAAAEFLAIPPAELYSKFKECLVEEQRVLQEASLRERVGVAENLITNTDHNGNETSHRGNLTLKNQKFSNFTLKVSILHDKIGNWSSNCEAMQILAGEMQELRREQKEAYELRKEAEQWRHPFSKALKVIKFVGTNQQPREDKNGENVRESETTPDYEGLRLEREIQNKIILLNLHDGECSRSFGNLVMSLEDLVNELLHDYIYELKWSEVSIDELGCSFDDLKKCYTDLLDILLQLQSFNSSLCHVIFQRTPNIILQTKLTRLETYLRTNVLIVQEQPLQVLKTQRKFDTSVLFLGDERSCHRSSRSFQPVKISLINEEQAATLHQNWTPDQNIYDGCGTIVNNKGSEFITEDSPPLLTVQFKNLAISSVRRGTRGERNRLSRAMTEKFCLMYSTKLDYNGSTYEVWCCSVPFVLYVHVCQKPEGWATIFWDKFLHDKKRTPLSVPEKVPWSKMTLAITKCFKYLTNTEWTLTEANLNCIGVRIFKRTDFNDNTLISLQEIIEKENGTRNSFWDWFYSIIELTNKHLRPIWDKGKVVGFIDRECAEEILKNYPPGTLMLRFSDTRLGAISIVYRGSHGINDIHSLFPFSDEDLTIRSLSERIHDSAIFQYIFYFNSSSNSQGRLVGKEQVFKKRMSSPVDSGNGELDTSIVEEESRPYKRCRVVMVIDDPPGISPPCQVPVQIERPFAITTPQIYQRMTPDDPNDDKIDRLVTMVGTLTEKVSEVKARLQTIEEGMAAAGSRMPMGHFRRKLEEKQKKNQLIRN